MTTIFKELLINEQIQTKEVRLIDQNGEQLGVIPFQKALELSESEGLDLVLLNASASPFVCKIMDYGKYKFDTIKKEKELKRNQKIVELKEIQLSLTIQGHDIDYRVKAGKEFLEDGNKVKISLRMKGRQQAFVQNAISVVNGFAEKLSEYGTPEKAPEVNGRNIYLVIAPKKQ